MTRLRIATLPLLLLVVGALSALFFLVMSIATLIEMPLALYKGDFPENGLTQGLSDYADNILAKR